MPRFTNLLHDDKQPAKIVRRLGGSQAQGLLVRIVSTRRRGSASLAVGGRIDLRPLDAVPCGYRQVEFACLAQLMQRSSEWASLCDLQERRR